jgi:hypothetical protein
MTDIHPNSRYRTVGYKITNTTKVAAITAGAGSFVDVVKGQVVASTGSSGSLSVYYYDSSAGVEYTILYEAEVPAVGLLVLTCVEGIHLDQSDEIRVEGENNMHVTLVALDAGRELGIR